MPVKRAAKRPTCRMHAVLGGAFILYIISYYKLKSYRSSHD